MTKIILAPHADDEVIGCSTLLDKDTIVYYTYPMADKRKQEAEELADKIGMTVEFVSKTSIAHILNQLPDRFESPIVLVPDPNWETHPEHRALGALVAYTGPHVGLRIATYSTTMSAPYILQLSECCRNRKYSLLNRYFPSQRSLWQNDHKYYLFEGIAEWNPDLG